jgi:ectoine hydroxylase-related dioxygenase (phytanoyl-CoA dioxygenase family)
MLTEAQHGTHGVLERLKAEDAYDEVAAELRVNGYAILGSGFSAEFIEGLKAGLDRAYATQVSEIGGDDVLRRMSDADVARCILAYEPDFMAVATAPSLIELAKRVLGSEFVLIMQNGIINRPDRENYLAKWHRDLSYQHWTSSKPLAINALLCIDDFTVENGATFVLPGTHHVTGFPPDRFVRKFEKQIEAPSGSYLVLDAMLFHRSGINRSANVRRAVNHVIGLPFMAQQIDIPSALASTGARMPESDAVRKYLGYRWSPASDVADWRSRRLPK